MVSESFDQTLRAFQRRKPFRPFTVEFVSGGSLEVDHPEALVLRGGVAVYISSQGTLTLFDHESVSRLIGETGDGSS
jgi:hypothetical protein